MKIRTPHVINQGKIIISPKRQQELSTRRKEIIDYINQSRRNAQRIKLEYMKNLKGYYERRIQEISDEIRPKLGIKEYQQWIQQKIIQKNNFVVALKGIQNKLGKINQ